MEHENEVESLFLLLFGAILLVSALMLLFLAYAERQLFSAVDPALFVTPFLVYALAMPCACLAMTLLPIYLNRRGAGSPTARLWLYPAAAFGTLCLLLFLFASCAVAYLIIL